MFGLVTFRIKHLSRLHMEDNAFLGVGTECWVGGFFFRNRDIDEALDVVLRREF
jgi:hypothetical protein